MEKDSGIQLGLGFEKTERPILVVPKPAAEKKEFIKNAIIRELPMLHGSERSVIFISDTNSPMAHEEWLQVGAILSVCDELNIPLEVDYVPFYDARREDGFRERLTISLIQPPKVS